MKNNYVEKPPLIKLLINLINNFPNERMSYVLNVGIDLGWFSVFLWPMSLENIFFNYIHLASSILRGFLTLGLRKM